MKTIKKETPHLFIRLNDFEGNDYIEEHKKIMDEKGYTWLLKVGKTMNKDYINEIIEKNGGIILKASAKRGNQFYYCDLESADPQNEKLIYPKYYSEYFMYEGYDESDVKNIGYWFKIKNIRKISDEVIEKFVIAKSEKPMLECAKFSRVVHMYVKNLNEMKI